MKTILKIGDPIYSQSIKRPVRSYHEGFPQREQFLLEHVKDIQFDTFKHEVLKDIDDVVRERNRLKERIQQKKYDYLMVDNPFSALVVERDVEVPILFDCIDWYDEIYLKEFGIDKRYYLLRHGLLDLLERASKVVAQSPVILDALKAWGLRTEDVAIIPNGYDGRIFHPFPSDKIASLRTELGAKYGVQFEGKDIVVYSGKLSLWYDAVKNVADAIADDQIFLIVGDGPLLSEIRDRPNVIKCGAVDFMEVPIYTNVADVLILPVDNDCSPIVLSEYLALGKPIVMPKGRIEWLFKDGNAGCLIDNNVYSWKRGIERALENRKTFGAQSLALAKNLTWQELGRKFSNFVSEQRQP